MTLNFGIKNYFRISPRRIFHPAPIRTVSALCHILTLYKLYAQALRHQHCGICVSAREKCPIQVLTFGGHRNGQLSSILSGKRFEYLGHSCLSRGHEVMISAAAKRYILISCLLLWFLLTMWFTEPEYSVATQAVSSLSTLSLTVGVIITSRLYHL